MLQMHYRILFIVIFSFLAQAPAYAKSEFQTQPPTQPQTQTSSIDVQSHPKKSSKKSSHPTLPEYRATYSLSWRRIPAATSYHHLYKAAPHRYVAQVVSSPNIPNLPYKSIETSVFMKKKAQLTPLEYSYEIVESSSKKGQMIFDWVHKKVKIIEEYVLPQELKLSQDLQDKITEHLQLRLQLQEDLEKGIHRKSYNYSVVDRNQIKPYQFNFIEEEFLKTPIGELATVKFEHLSKDKKRKTLIWLAKDHHFLLIKLQQFRKDTIVVEGNIETYQLETQLQAS